MTSELSGKQKEFALYKSRINDAVKKILFLLDKTDKLVRFENYPAELKAEFQEINYALSSIAGLVGGRKSRTVANGISQLQLDLRRIGFSQEPLSSHRVLVEDWLTMANCIFAEFNDSGRPVKVMFEFGALGAKLKAFVSKGSLS